MPKIVIADDDELLSSLVHFKLEMAGHHVLLAENGEEALALAKAHGPDLIIMDAMMPVLTGPEALARLKDDPGTAAIPVIMLTARRGQEDVVTALRGGAADYLTKPFIPEELLARVEAALAKGSGGASRHRA